MVRRYVVDVDTPPHDPVELDEFREGLETLFRDWWSRTDFEVFVREHRMQPGCEPSWMS